jgi:hypothetical protein
LATETDRRIQKELADQIAKIVSQNGKDGWSFAAPAEIHSGDRRFVAWRCATANCRTREIGFGEGRTGQTDQPFPIVAANLKCWNRDFLFPQRRIAA